MRVLEIIVNIILLLFAWVVYSITAPFTIGYSIGLEIIELFEEYSTNGEDI